MIGGAPDTKEKTGCLVAYLTLGIWGFIWLMISRTPAHNQKDFVKFHCYQSIFIGILYMFIPSGISITFSLIIQIIALIPGTLGITSALTSIHGLLQQLVSLAGLAFILYCAIFSAMGKYTNIPYISQMINRMLR